jgi:alpha-galactosidase
MAKIAFIGAGSFEFTRRLVRDLLSYERLRDATIALMDIDQERLGFIRQAVERIVAQGGYPARIETHSEPGPSLYGADAVVCTILAGGVGVWRHDVEIPMRYGVDINVGDTRGPAGIFRALRTIPVMLDICRQMERQCPQALLLNYTNPMAMLCRAMQRQTKIRVTGLCHSVQGTAKMLARWIGAAPEDLRYTCAGINHLAWFIRLNWHGQDAYPLLRQAVEENEEIYREEIVRNEMFLNLGYYVTESSGHNSEYNWWFRKRPDLIERYCRRGTGWNPGEQAYILKEYLDRETNWRRDIQEWLADQQPLDLARGDEYAAPIINAYLGGEPYRFNGNVKNSALITNLPQDACVEVPVYIDRDGLHPIHVGCLPPECAMLTALNVAVEELAVEGCLAGDPLMVFKAIAHDPLTAAVLSLAEIRQMVRELFAQNRDHLPTFGTVAL